MATKVVNVNRAAKQLLRNTDFSTVMEFLADEVATELLTIDPYDTALLTKVAVRARHYSELMAAVEEIAKNGENNG